MSSLFNTLKTKSHIKRKPRTRNWLSHLQQLEQLERREMLSVNWADTFGTASGDRNHDMQVDANGSSYVAGYFSAGTIDFDDENAGGEITNSSRGSDGYLTKYDNTGNFEWVIHAASSNDASVRGVSLDSQGNAYIVGVNAAAELSFYKNGSLEVSIPTGRRTNDTFVAKISPSGSVDWVDIVGTGNIASNADLIDIIENPSTGEISVLLAGHTLGRADFDPGPSATFEGVGKNDRYGFLGKYTVDRAQGSLELEWLQSRYLGNVQSDDIGLSDRWLTDIKTSGGETVAVGPTVQDAIYVGVFADDGTLLVENESENVGGSYVRNIAVDVAGQELFISGRHVGSADFDRDGVIDSVGDDVTRGFVTKLLYDTAGNDLSVSWVASLEGGESMLNDVSFSAAGVLRTVGSFSNSIDAGAFNVDSVGSHDGLVATIDAGSGNFVNARRFGGDGSDRPRYVENGPSGKVHIAGETLSTQFSLVGVTETFASHGGMDGFITAYMPIASEPPTADAGASESGNEEDVLTFDASGSSDPDGDALTYRWDFGDGETAETNNTTVSHAYAYGGTFDITLNVLDGNGNSATDVTAATVTEVNDAPVANAGGPYDGVENEAVTLNASLSFDFDNRDGTTANDQALNYLWDFDNDGTVDQTTSTPTVDHVFATAGSYVTKLTVDDGLQTAETTAAVTISERPAGIELYIYDIRFDSKRGGKDYRAVVEIRTVEGDVPTAGVMVKVDFDGTTYDLVTDGSGIARSSWERNLASGDYYADAYDLVLVGHVWNPFDFDLEDDSDDDGNADALLVV